MLRMGGKQRNTTPAYSRVIFATLTGVLLLAAGAANAAATRVENVTCSLSENTCVKAGGVVPVTVTYTNNVTVTIGTSAPTLSLNSGGSAVYLSGSGTKNLLFNYTVVQGENAAILDYASTSPLVLHGSTLIDNQGVGTNVSGLAFPAPGGANSLRIELIIIDTNAPTTTIGAPSRTVTKNSNVTYTVTYADAGSGVSAITLATNKVTLNKTGTANGSVAVSGSGATRRTVTVSGITGNGTLGISIASGTATDKAGNGAVAAGPAAVFTVDNTGPAVTISAPSSAGANSAASVTYTVDYADTGSSVTAITLATNKVTLNKTDSANGTVAVSGTGTSTRTVTISGVTGVGTLGISVAAGTATDGVGNTALTAGPSATFKLDNAAPTGSISINTTTPPYVNSGTANLTLSAADGSGSGVTQMRFSNDNSTWSGWGTYATGASWALSAGDGTKTVYAQFKDAAGNSSASASANITVDTAPPTGTIYITPTVTGFVNSGTVTLALTSTDGAGSGGVQMRFSNDNITWSTPWDTAAASKSWPLSALPTVDGVKTVYVQFKDAAGNESASYSDTIKVDTTRPTGTLSINGGASETGQTLVTLTIADEDNGGSGVTKMRFSNDGTTWNDWTTHAQTAPWTLTGGHGDKTVYMQLKDGAGNESFSIPAYIKLDITKPGVLLTTSAGDATKNAPISVTATFTESVKGFTTGGVTVDNGTVTGFSGTDPGTAYALTVTPAHEGAVVVHVDAGVAEEADGDRNFNVASNVLTVLYDNTAPSGTILINGGSAYTTTKGVSLTMDIADAGGSGVLEMRMCFSNEETPGTFSDWQPYTSSAVWDLSADDGFKTVHAQVRDMAGNVGEFNDSITLDTAAPTGTVSINGDAAFVDTDEVTLTLSASDAAPGSGLSKMRFSNDNSTWSAWQTNAASHAWTLADVDGITTVYAQFQDAAGNVSNSYSDTIFLDTELLRDCA